MGEPMPLSIPRYDVVRNGSAPVRINSIAFETRFFAVRPRTVISEPTGTSDNRYRKSRTERAGTDQDLAIAARCNVECRCALERAKGEWDRLIACPRHQSVNRSEHPEG
jgi:hypothetical protein